MCKIGGIVRYSGFEKYDIYWGLTHKHSPLDLTGLWVFRPSPFSEIWIHDQNSQIQALITQQRVLNN